MSCPEFYGGMEVLSQRTGDLYAIAATLAAS